jgi:hypothetical protein
VEIKVIVSTGYMCSERETTIEVDDEKWNAMTEQEKQDMADQCVWEFAECTYKENS